VSQELETFEQWRERTAPSPARPPARIWTVRELLVTGVGLGVCTLVPLALGVWPAAWVTGIIAFGALVRAAQLAWVPARHQVLADVVCSIVMFALVGAFWLLTSGKGVADWIGLALAVLMLAALKLRDWYARR